MINAICNSGHVCPFPVLDSYFQVQDYILMDGEIIRMAYQLCDAESLIQNAAIKIILLVLSVTFQSHNTTN